MFTWGLGCVWFCVGLFAANLIWLVIFWSGRRVAEREHNSICDQISRDGRAEIDRLRGIIWTHEDTIRDHKEQIANREQQVANLESEREKSTKRILSLQDSYSEKCVELDAMNWEINAGRDVRATALELSQMLSEFLQGTDGPRAKNMLSPETFQPKRPEDQPQKPTCDN